MFKTFGPKYGAQVYSWVLMGNLLEATYATLQVQFLFKPLGPENIFHICTGISVLCLINIFLFRERLDIERLDKKGLIEWGEPIEQKESMKKSKT